MIASLSSFFASLNSMIEANTFIAILFLLIGFMILAKSADYFVDASVCIAEKANIPRIVIGIVLVSLATTAPELSVSLMSALADEPEMALGNAVGSVICNSSLALPIIGIFAASPILVSKYVMRISGSFLISIGFITFFCVFKDYRLSSLEGSLLVAMFITYLTVLFYENKQGKYTDNADFEEPELGPQSSYPKLAGIFVISVTLLIFASKLIVTSATSIAAKIGIPPAVISLTVVAFGTSIPEVATCVTAAKKKFGSVAIGNIIGANIMNICWVAGASAMINPLQIQKADTYFMFPWMLGMTILVLALIAYQMRLTKFKGYILLIMYVLYIISFIAYYDPFNKEEQGITQPTKEEVSLNHAAYNHFNGC